MEQRKQAGPRKLILLLVLALLAYTVKNIFVGADIDEGYGIMVGYRLAMGDKLLLEMWEPHQTSAIFTALFIKPFLWLTGGVNFLTLYLRVVYFLVHGGIAFFLYRTFRKCVFRGESPEEKWMSALLSLFFYVNSPKSIFVPEYSNLHIWFFTMLIACLVRYYFGEERGRLLYLIVGGFFLTCDVLAYPSMVILCPFILLFILSKQKRGAIREPAAFFLPCIVSVLVFFGYVLSYMSLEQIGQVLPLIVGEDSHAMTVREKVGSWLFSFGEMGVLLLTAAVLSGVLGLLLRKKTAPDFLWFAFWMLFAYQVYCWIWGSYSAIHPQILYVMLPLSGVACVIWKQRRSKAKSTQSSERPETQDKPKTQEKQKDSEKVSMGILLMGLSFVSYFAVILLSNWEPILLNTYLVVAVLGGVICLYGVLADCAGKGRKYLLSMCVVLILGNAFGYSYLIIGADEGHCPVTMVGGVNTEGFRGGIFNGYMTAKRYNDNIEIWSEAVPAGSTVLYVGPSQFYAMLGEHTQASPDTICSLVYNERLLKYWEMNPERYPDVVVVESWFGEIRENTENEFILKWIDEEFNPSGREDYSYITVFYQ